MIPMGRVSPHYIERDGHKIAYRVQGEGPITILFLPCFQISDSRIYRAQADYFRHFYRVVSYDARGTGWSSKPESKKDYACIEMVKDGKAIIDALGIEKVIAIGVSRGGHMAAVFAANFPETTQAAVLMAATCPFGPNNPAMVPENIMASREQYKGWEKYNVNYIQEDFEGFKQFFLREALSDQYTEKMLDDAFAWCNTTSAEVIAKVVGSPPNQETEGKAVYQKIQCPLLIIHGEEDKVVPFAKGRYLAEMLGAEFYPMPNCGHVPNGRYPVEVNRKIESFLSKIGVCKQEEITGAPAFLKNVGSGKRALYLSSPIGLGHVRRDLAIATALKQLHDDLDIQWLTQDPAIGFLEAANEFVHPLSYQLECESQQLEFEAGEHDLHAFRALQNMDSLLVSNFLKFQHAIEDQNYDIVIADEAWDIDRFWHEHPSLKKSKLAWMTDFVGVVPMPSSRENENTLAEDFNREMVSLVEKNRQVRDASIFVGDPEDLVDHPLAPGLPSISEWTKAHFDFGGYISGFNPETYKDSALWKRKLGYGPDEKLCIVAVGGTQAGAPLIRKILDCATVLQQKIPTLRMIVVTGPRLEKADLPSVPGVQLLPFLPDFLSYLAACDVAVVQGGLTTCMELTALAKPFIYVPLQNHFEQQVHVDHRLQRYGAGKRLDYEDICAERLSIELQLLLQPQPKLVMEQAVLPVSIDGAEVAARAIANLL